MLFRSDDNSCPRVREGVKIIAHESYGGMNAPENFDLALIKLSAPIPEGYIITKFYDGASDVDRNEMIIAGYGLTSRLKADHGILRATQKLFRDSVKVISKTSVIYDQTDKKGICEGDSGGPTLVHVNNEYQVFSINSTFIHPKNGGDGCLGTAKSAYIPFHKNWIYEKLKLLSVTAEEGISK